MREGPMAGKTRIHDALSDRDVTQQQIAVDLELSKPTVSRIINGIYQMIDIRARRTVVRVLRRVSEVTEIPLAELASDQGIEGAELSRLLNWVERFEEQRAERKHAAATAAA